MISSRVLQLVLFAAILVPVASQEVSAKTNCQLFFDKYLNAPGHKAFATTMGHDPGYHPTSCSMIAGFSFKKLAEKQAVADCNRHSRQEDGGHCRVIDSK